MYSIKGVDLAGKLDISTNAMSNLRNSKTMPRLDGVALDLLCNALNELAQDLDKPIAPADLLDYLPNPVNPADAGILGLLDWLKKAEPYYQKSVNTIKRWFGEVAGYFDKKTTNGVVEGINNKLKLIKRSGFGFNNFRNFEIRALLSWHYNINLAS